MCAEAETKIEAVIYTHRDEYSYEIAGNKRVGILCYRQALHGVQVYYTHHESSSVFHNSIRVASLF